MKDKYDKCFYENEIKNSNTEKIKKLLLKIKYYLHVLNKSGYKDFKIVVGKNINFIIITLNMMPDYLQEWIINNVINCVNHQSLMLTYIYCLNYFLTTKEYGEVLSVMNSFKKSGIIKDIKLDKNNNTFQMETLDGKLIKFMPEFSNAENIDACRKKCHEVVEYLCKKINNIYAVTGIMKNYFGKTYYHSFVVKDNVVHDFAQNIVMNYDSYKELFGCKVIMNIEGKQLLKNINILRARDMEFKQNEMFDILKYAMHKQMKKEKNIVK